MIPAHISLSSVKKWCEVNSLAHLGIEITEIGSDYICGTMPVDQRTHQPFGILHGGMSVVLAESLGSIGSNLIVQEAGKIAVGLEVNANHVSSVKEGLVTGKATLVHSGSQTHIWDIRITTEKNKLVCISRLTIAILNKPK
jgi:1,4-dihydroxy-2-naphthoyl-CoA hydrolase